MKSVRELARYVNEQVVMSVLDSAADEIAPQEYLPRRVGHLLAARWSDSGRLDDVP